MLKFATLTEEQAREYIKRATRLYLEERDQEKTGRDLVQVLKRETTSAMDEGYAEKYVRLDICLKLLKRA